ncbi:MAG: 30S ribosomal protein S6 [Candidatus Pelagibacter sp.]|nr:30S ribosomal protein S6 [Candidatus Pelagibacter sp.]OUV87393.1 MAG: 30S ribosomal protein S6 [Pelagibacteraceae bacterium TMED136]
MNIYEHTYIAAPEANKKDIENIEKKIEDILNKSSGKIHKTEDWGLRNLAYQVKKNNKGYYRNLYLEGSKDSIKEIEKYEKFDEKIIKFLSIKLKSLPKEDSELSIEKN